MLIEKDLYYFGNDLQESTIQMVVRPKVKLTCQVFLVQVLPLDVSVNIHKCLLFLNPTVKALQAANLPFFPFE